MSLTDVSRKRVLFVDDELSLLKGIENVLRPDRHRWEMVFALGAEDALDELRRRAFDAVVSDLRMPGTDGVALLAIIKRQWPRTARVLLTGSAGEIDEHSTDAEAILEKPCRPALLRSVLERVMNRPIEHGS